MRLYKMVDRFDPKTGKKLKPQMEECGVICDFTGKTEEFPEGLGTEYSLEYNSLDPCGGCGVGENEFAKKWKIEIHDFLFGSPYIFDESDVDMEDVIKQAKEAGFDRPCFDQLFRWCRIRTAERLLSEGKYTLEELGMEKASWMIDDEDDE